MTCCRTVDEVIAAAIEDSKDDPPISQETADLLAAIKARHGLGRPAAAARLASEEKRREASEAA